MQIHRAHHAKHTNSTSPKSANAPSLRDVFKKVEVQDYSPKAKLFLRKENRLENDPSMKSTSASTTAAAAAATATAITTAAAITTILEL